MQRACRLRSTSPVQHLMDLWHCRSLANQPGAALQSDAQDVLGGVSRGAAHQLASLQSPRRIHSPAALTADVSMAPVQPLEGVAGSAQQQAGLQAVQMPPAEANIAEQLGLASPTDLRAQMPRLSQQLLDGQAARRAAFNSSTLEASISHMQQVRPCQYRRLNRRTAT